MSKTLALQKALRAAFIASPGVVALVPAANIVDRHRRPAPSPSIVLGEVAAGPDTGNAGRDRQELFADVHVWVAEPSTEGVKQIVAAVSGCIWPLKRPVLDGGFHLADWEVVRVRVLRDPSGDTSHGVVTVRALIGGGAI